MNCKFHSYIATNTGIGYGGTMVYSFPSDKDDIERTYRDAKISIQSGVDTVRNKQLYLSDSFVEDLRIDTLTPEQFISLTNILGESNGISDHAGFVFNPNDKFDKRCLSTLLSDKDANKIRGFAKYINKLIKDRKRLSFEDKKDFERKSASFLRTLANQVGLNKDEVDIHYNKGGNAVSGDSYLVADNIYVDFNADGITPKLMFRDNIDGRNYFAEWDKIAENPARLIYALKATALSHYFETNRPSIFSQISE